MPGIEVAGLVLGAIPIATAALKELNNTTDKVERFRKWRSELPSFVRRLNAQRICLVQSLHLLFRVSNLPPPDLNDLDKDHQTPLWKNPDIVARLKSRHGDVYEAVESEYVAILSHMRVLCEKIGLGDFVQVSDLKDTWSHCLSTPGRRLKFRDRVIYTISGDEVRQLLNQIDNRQQSIRGILSDIYILTQLPQSISTDRLYEKLASAQKDATMIHTALRGVLTCTKHAHCARLELDADWGDIFVPDLPPHACQKRSFRITLNAPDADDCIFTEVKIVSNNSEQKCVSVNGTKLRPIGRLCEDLRIAKLPMKHIGLHVDESLGPILFGVHLPPDIMKGAPQERDAPHRFVSLRELLAPSAFDFSKPCKAIGEGVRKLLLARVSPYAVMLESTPWRSEIWRTEDIEFLLNDDKGSSASVDFRRPFVSHFPQLCQSTLVPAAATPQKSWNTSRQFALNFCLLTMELCLGEKFGSPKDPSSPYQFHEHHELKILTDLLRLKEDRWDDFSATIRDVITPCLCLAIRPSFSLRKREDLEEVVEKIVLPIKSEYDVFAGVSRGLQ